MFGLRKLLCLSVIAFSAFGLAQDKNDVKGQDQMKGSMGSFGTTYTLSNKFNLTILGAHYTLDPQEGYYETTADTDGKVLVMNFALKNADTNDQFVNTDGWFTFIDDAGQEYKDCSVTLQSKGSAGLDVTLKPGQGIGQPSLNDPLQVAVKIPGKAKITKLVLNLGRLNSSEQVMRFLMVEPPKDASSGVKNFIGPLPAGCFDASDAWGAVTVDEGKAVVGQSYPSSGFMIRLDDLSSPDGVVYGGNPPDDGKRYVVATVSGKWMLEKEDNVFDLEGGGDPQYLLTDTDGEQYKPLGFKKPKADEDPDRTFKKGDEYSVRVFFEVPKDAKLKHFTMAAAGGRKWGLDLP